MGKWEKLVSKCNTAVDALLVKSNRDTEHANILMMDCCSEAVAAPEKLSLFSMSEVAVWKIKFPNSEAQINVTVDAFETLQNCCALPISAAPMFHSE